MRPDWSDYPLSLFSAVGTHFLSRIVVLPATLAAGLLSGAMVACWGQEPGMAATTILAMYPMVVVVGIAQLWGLAIYGFLALYLAVLFFTELSPRALALVFTLQALEAWRWFRSWLETSGNSW